MSWVIQLIVFQIVFAEAITAILLLIWKVSNKNEKFL